MAEIAKTGKPCACPKKKPLRAEAGRGEVQGYEDNLAKQA